MIAYLLPLIIILAIPCHAMDKPAPESTPLAQGMVGILCAPLQGRGKFSPDGQKVLVAQDIHISDWETKHGDLHIQDVHSGQKKTLEKSSSSALSPKKTYSHSYFKYSWSPQGTLVKASYFTDMQQIVPGQYDGWRARETEDKLPMNVLKVWNKKGQLLYQRHLSSGVKSYFSANDQYLLVKERENPLLVHDALTGKQLAQLGQASECEGRLPVDPQNRWLVAITPDQSSTVFYDYQNFTPLQTILAHIAKFSADGNLFLAKETTTSDSSQPETCCSSGDKYLAYFCVIYNRQFQKIGSFNSGWLHKFAFSPCRKAAFSFDHEKEICVDIASNKELASTTHPMVGTSYEFLCRDLTRKLTLTPDKEKSTTLITLSQDGQPSQQIRAPILLNGLFYTPIPDVVALAYYTHIDYLFNTKTKVLTPCNHSLVSALFRERPLRFVSQDGHYITRTAPRLKCIIQGREIFDTNTGYELRRLS